MGKIRHTGKIWGKEGEDPELTKLKSRVQKYQCPEDDLPLQVRHSEFSENGSAIHVKWIPKDL